LYDGLCLAIGSGVVGLILDAAGLGCAAKTAGLGMRTNWAKFLDALKVFCQAGTGVSLPFPCQIKIYLAIHL